MITENGNIDFVVDGMSVADQKSNYLIKNVSKDDSRLDPRDEPIYERRDEPRDDGIIDFIDVIEWSSNDRSIKNESNVQGNYSADHVSYKSGTQQIASFHQAANRGETREYDPPKMDMDILSQKLGISNITYSKLSGIY